MTSKDSMVDWLSQRRTNNAARNAYAGESLAGADALVNSGKAPTRGAKMNWGSFVGPLDSKPLGGGLINKDL